MDKCSKTGGRVTLAGGTFLAFSVSFSGSHTELHIAAGATLKASNNMTGWKNGKVGSAIIVAKARRLPPRAALLFCCSKTPLPAVCWSMAR